MKNTVEIRNYPKFQLIKSNNESLIIIKVDNISNGLKEVGELLLSELKTNYLEQAGVYFLRLEDGYYIGETKKLQQRFYDHFSNKVIESITFATYKSKLDELNKEEIRDLESILMEFANDSGLTLGNSKKENRKTYNFLHHRDHRMTATWVWKNFAYLNMNDILDEVKSSKVIQEIEEVKPSVKEKREKWDVASLISMGNVRDHIITKEHEIFDYVPHRQIPTSGYSKERIEIFNKDLAKKALFMYLFKGTGNGSIDKELTNSKRNKGWVTAVTLAYFRIETGGAARASLSEQFDDDGAKELINSFVDECY